MGPEQTGEVRGGQTVPGAAARWVFLPALELLWLCPRHQAHGVAGSRAGSPDGICISLALVMSGACLCEVPGAVRTKGSRRLGNNKDEEKREAKFLKAMHSACLVIDTQTQEGRQGPIFILKLPLTSQTCWAVFAVEITSPSPTTHRLLKEQPLQKGKKKKKKRQLPCSACRRNVRKCLVVGGMKGGS